MNTSYTYTYQALGHTVGVWNAEIWETDINQEDNSSIVHINFYIRVAHNNKVSNTWNESNMTWSEIIIDGERVLLQAPGNYDLRYNDMKQVPNGTIYNLGTVTKKIYHDKDGSKTINVVCHHDCGGMAPTNVYCQGDFTLQKINIKSASVLSFNSAIYDVNSTIDMSISASHSNFRHSIKLSYGGYSEEYTNLAAGNHKITLPSNWRSVLIAGKTANIIVYCYTYEGNTLIGYTSKVLTIMNKDSHATLTVPDGVYNIGSRIDFVVTTTNDYMTYTIDYNSTEYPTWIIHTIGEKLAIGNNTLTLKEIPWSFKNGLMDQETTTMNLRLRTYHSGELVGTEIKEVIIRNDAYILNISGSINKDSYTENGHYIAGITRFFVDYSVQSSFDIRTIKINVMGANSDSEQFDLPRKSGSWTSNILTNEGETIVRITAIDIAGHEAYKDIETVITKDTSTLVVKRFEELNKKVFLKEANPLGAHRFKIYCAWENTYPIEGIRFEVTGANTFTKEVSAPTGNSYTWETDEVTVAGVNMINMLIADTNGTVKSASFSAKSLINEPHIELDETCIDKTICIGLVDNEIYKDETRIGIRISVQHTYTIQTIKIIINEREHQLLDFDGEATTFFFLDEQRIEEAGTLPIIVHVKDVMGEEANITLSATVYEAEIGPEPPVIEYEEPEEKVFISEGEKIMFQGHSTDLADYQIIYAVSECDIINATKFCDDIDGGYMNADRVKLRKHCLDHVSPGHRFHILKDFGVSGDDTFVFQDSKKKNRFYIYPYDEESEGFYALQFFPEARPGDLIYIYVRERKKCALNRWAYSDHHHHHHLIPITKFFPICVIPAAPLSLTIYKVEQTDKKLKIQYKNPLYNEDNSKKDAIHLIDVCLIVKDNAGNILDTQGKKSKSDSRRRDALWGRTWLYFTERKWHNCVPKGTTNYNDKEIFDMEFDISRYPKNANLFVVAFYYADYYRHPSVYSTSNIININKPSVNMNIQFLEPENETVSLTPNPTFKIRVNKVEEDGINYTTIYENFNWAIKWSKPHWHKHPIWFRCPRRLDHQMPHFHEDHCWRHCHPWHNHWGPKHHIHFFHRHHHCHHHHEHFKIPDLPVNTENNFKDCALFICANDNNAINLGDVDIDTLLEKGHVDYTWTQENGKFLSVGENKIDAYTCPYKEVEEEKDDPELHLHHLHYKHHLCHHGHWLCSRTFISLPVMAWNPFSYSVLRPMDDPWDKVETTILNLKIPYHMLKENRSYTFKFLSFADRGFHYPNRCSIPWHRDLDRLCAARVFIDVLAPRLKACKWIHDNIIYRPHYHLVETNQESVEVNHYGRWVTHTVSFSTPDLNELEDCKRLGHHVQVIIKIRGIHTLKIKGISLSCSDNTISEMVQGELDTSVKENKTSMTLAYPGVITPTTPDLPDGYIYHDYIDPLKYDQMINLRKYLETISQVYAVSSVTAKWRTLIRNQSYLMARDFNDVKDYCINLFTAIEDRYKSSFKGDVQLFKDLPTIKPNDRRGPRNESVEPKSNIIFNNNIDKLVIGTVDNWGITIGIHLSTATRDGVYIRVGSDGRDDVAESTVGTWCNIPIDLTKYKAVKIKCRIKHPNVKVGFTSTPGIDSPIVRNLSTSYRITQGYGTDEYTMNVSDLIGNYYLTIRLPANLPRDVSMVYIDYIELMPNQKGKRSDHYFPEWDDLIDALNAQITRPAIIFGSTVSKESATWSHTDNKWIRHNQSTYIRNTEIVEPEPTPPPTSEPETSIFKSSSCATWYRKFWDNPFTNWDNWYPNIAYAQHQHCIFDRDVVRGRETILREAFYFFNDKSLLLLKAKAQDPFATVTFKFRIIPLKHIGPEIAPGTKFEIYSHPYSSVLFAHGTRNTCHSKSTHLGTATVASDGLTLTYTTTMNKIRNDMRGVIVTCSSNVSFVEKVTGWCGGDYRLRDYCEIEIITNK